MNIQLIRRFALLLLPLTLSVNLYVVDASTKSKQPDRDSKNIKSKRESKSDRATNGRNKSESRTQTLSRLGSADKRSIEENSTKRRADRGPATRSSKAAKSSRSENAINESRSARRHRLAELRRAEERRSAEAARLAAVAREQARNEDLREHVQSLIAKDDLTGEDPEVRRIAVSALGNHAGTVVVMNPQTGRIYSMVNQQWAMREGFKPCSTIKLVTSVAGLNENVIDPNDTTKISDTNQVTLTRALAYSKNGYFQTVGEQVGAEKMVSYARRLGLGEKTGINARHEFQGRVPGSDSFRAIHRMSSHGDHYEVTAVQLAILVSAFANGGKLLTPYVVRNRQDEAKLKTKVRRTVNIDREVWQQVLPGMVGAVNYGSGKHAYDPAQQVAGKTGTCIEDGRWVGLFTSYAPVANPKLAVVVITRGADARSHFPAAVAGRIYRELGSKYGAPAGLQVASKRDVGSPDNHGSSETDDEEETALVEEANYNTETTTVFRNDRERAGKVRPVLMSIPSPRVVTKPAEDINDEPPTGGQTRPRRVLGE